MASPRHSLTRILCVGLLAGMALLACQGPEEFFRSDGGLSGLGGSPPGSGGSGSGGKVATGGITGTGGTATGGITGTGGTATGGITGTGGKVTGTGGTATGGVTGTGGAAGATGTGPCAGLCTSTATIAPKANSGDLGTGATCQEVTGGTVTGLVCGNFVAPRTFTVNGMSFNCTSGGTFTLPAEKNGGYCMQASAGNYSYAYFGTY